MNVTQTSSKAILNWANFNIASGYTVNFIQPSATAAVLNNIWSANPTAIAGQLNANGQVYLYNQNGIVFDKGAQINVAGLSASTLNLPSTTFENGILAANTPGTVPGPVFVAPAIGTAGAVTVDAGATLTAADGGRIMLLGSAVTNQGTISTPDGQTILGAGTNSVYLAASTNAALRGLLIEVNGGGTTGTVINQGQITAARGNITLAGLVVNQEGILSATTSVNANGSIYLVAGDTSGSGSYYNPIPEDPNKVSTAFGGLLPNVGGTLILAPGSVTEVLPDPTDTGTLTQPQIAGFIPSQVEMAGRVVALDGTATVRAPGGQVNVYAAGDPYQLNADPKVPAADGGSIYVDNASTIDVSGLSKVAIPVTDNIIQVTLETDDLQDDPLLRTGFLHGTTVTVDVRDPPSLFNVTPYADNIGSTVQQILTAAGSIDLDATGSVITRAGSTLNVSGGSIAYQGGVGPSTTNLLAANGQVYNIATAPSDIPYVAIANNYSYTDPTWGTTNKGNGQSYYQGYTQGANAGTITVAAPAVYLRGDLSAATVDGLNQRAPATLPAGGTLVVGCGSCTTNSVTNPAPNYGLDGGVSFANGLSDNLNGNVIVDGYVVSSVSLPSLTTLSPTQLEQSGFNTLEVFSNGSVVLPAGTNISLAANGGFTAKSTASIAIDGNITIPGGSVSLATASGGDLVPHDVSLGANAIIDVSGSWTNDAPTVTLQPGTAPTVVNGGSVSIAADGDVMLEKGSVVDVSGGAWLNDASKLTTGSAGSISLAASFNLTPATAATSPYTGAIDFGANAALLGASLKAGQGGTLSLQAGSVTVGVAPAKTPGELLLAPGFFQQGGFAQYKITGQNDVIIGDLQDTSDEGPVTISPLQQTLAYTKNPFLEPTGTPLSSFTQLATLPQSLRQPASVSFIATGNDVSGAEVGDVTLAQDASIVTDPGASVFLGAYGYTGSVRVYGSIYAPAGAIALQVVNPTTPQLQSSADPGYVAGQEVLLGPDAKLSAPGYVESNTLNELGYLEGSVLGGGSVSLIATKGYVDTELGSLINVNGAAGVLDVQTSTGVKPNLIAGNAGSITIEAREGIVLQGGLLGQAAAYDGATVNTASGGTLTVALGPTYSYTTTTGNDTGTYPTPIHTLTIAGQGSDGLPAVPPSNQLLPGTAVVDASTVAGGGFANVTLSSADTIAFAGTVNLQANASLTLDAPVFTAAHGTQVNLSSAYVAVGNFLNNTDYFDPNTGSPNAAAVLNPTSGTAILNVNAQLIDIRGISGWNGFAQENFTSSGDLRFVNGQNDITAPPSIGIAGDPAPPPSFEGAFNTSATLNLSAAQLYPTTATQFAINDTPIETGGASAPSAAVVTIASSLPSGGAVPATPLSAGGSIAINATTIEQAGILRAPVGEIALNGTPIENAQGTITTPGSVTLASGGLTSVSDAGLTIPYGATSNGTQWTYSNAASFTEVLTQPPAKQISLNGSNVTVNSGATVDLSGGGDLYAYEFIAGEGGSVDVLDPANLPAAAHPSTTTVYTYAIVPTLGSSFAPLDPQYDQGSAVATGQTISLSGMPGLAAGTYALLPARYALLPGAYAIQVVQQNSALAPGSAVAEPGGAYLVAARFGTAGTTAQSSLTSTVLVASDATVRTESQYTDTYANAFFNAVATASDTVAPRLPADAGQLVLSAANSLSLNGTIAFTPGSFVSGTTASGANITQQGLGGDVAITAQNLVVVDAAAAQAPAATGTVQLNVQQLDNLDAQTLILGASSTTIAAGEQLNVGPTLSVELKNTTPLTAPEVILAAADSVSVDPGAAVTAGSSAKPVQSATLLLPGGGSLLRVSNGAADPLTIDPTTLPAVPTGTVTIGAGANVQATGSLLLYGTNTTTLAPGAQISAPSVSLYSSAVNLGSAPADAAGLTLTSQLLGSLKGLTELTIGSTSTINFYGAVQLGTAASATPNLNSITLDAAGLGGYGSGDKVLEAGTVTWLNSSGNTASFTGTPDGTGALQLVATATSASGSGQINLGAGDKTVSGFTAVNLQAAGDIVGQGTGSLEVATPSTPLNLTSVALIGAAGATQSLTTTGAVTITGSKAGNEQVLPAAGLGAALTVQGASIAQNGNIDLPAGDLGLSATSGNLSLGSGSVTSTAGAVQNYTVTEAVAPGGNISLAATTGNVVIGSGATVSVAGYSSSSVNGDAGTLSISAPLGSFSYAGSKISGAAATGQNAGNFSLDAASGLSGSGFSTLDTMLAASGFAGTIDLRSRNDAAVSITGDVKAASFTLSVDQGSIEVGSNAVLNTSGGATTNTDGGAIALWAGTGLQVAGGAKLLANAGGAGPTGANGSALASMGGDITLATATGMLSIAGGSAQQPTTISMQGGGGAATDGSLTLRAPRTADDSEVQITIANPSGLNVVSRNPVIVEGFKTYLASALGNTDSGCGNGGGCDINDTNGMLFSDAQSFVANTGAIVASLGLTNLEVRPGIEVDSTGDLIVNNTSGAWNLASWDAALAASEPANSAGVATGVPINLTLRAAGNLIFESSLSDGFTEPVVTGRGRAPPTPPAPSAWILGQPSGASSDSATYMLTGGADLSSANPLAVIAQPVTASSLGVPPNSGNVILTPGNLIRTGTGNIDIAAGGDVLLGYSVGDANGNLYDSGVLQVAESDPLSSVIYTAGVPSVLSAAQSALFIAPTLPRPPIGKVQAVASYPTDGGNITIAASDDIRSAPSTQLISDWLWRRAPTTAGVAVAPGNETTWWVMFSDFEQGIGALGGGNLSLSAGRDIVNVSAVVPTTGRVLVAADGTPAVSDLVLTGGGTLQVQAGGSIYGGLYEDDWGNASIAAGGALSSSADSTFQQEISAANLAQLPSPPPNGTEVYPILAVGNGVFTVNARTGIELDGVMNSTTLPLLSTNVSEFSGDTGTFFAYAPTDNPSTLNLISAGGNITLDRDVDTNIPIVALSAQGLTYTYNANPSGYTALYPSTLNVVSLSGDIDLGSTATGSLAAQNGVDITLYPSATGTLNLLAAGSVNNDGGQYIITVSQADPTQVPNFLAPLQVPIFNGVSGVALPALPLHQNDTQPVYVVANSGGIGSGIMEFPKAADVVAGGDITDLNYIGSNLNPSDVTLIAAGGSINYSTPTAPITNILEPNANGISLAGPGFLEVLAGGSINLGDAAGIVTTGNLSDVRLSSAGATIVVGAGLGANTAGGMRQPAYQNFINAYLAPTSSGAPSSYAPNLIAYMQQLYPTTDATLSYGAALSAFDSLPQAQQLPLIADVLSDILSATGLAHTIQGASYAPGYAAIDSLFPTKDAAGNALSYSGDLNMFYSQVKTEQGGDINVLVPGGSVVVGVANPPASLDTVKAVPVSPQITIPAAVNLGLLVLGQGAIQGFANEDWTVNQSRILTLEGGDIILWASNGNIDAGKGAKSASGAPSPTIEVNPQTGDVYVDPSNAVSGSGIGQLLTVPGIKAGLVNLIAPKGDVNAGDAGIRVAGNLNIAAVQVIGAGNITVVGTSTGVPTSEAGAFAGALSGANNLGDAGKSAVDQLTQDLGNTANYQQLTDSLAPAFIVVKMFCLGIECEQN